MFASELTLYETTLFLDWSKLRAVADDKSNVAENLELVLVKGRKHCGKRRKYWSSAFSPFPTMFSKGFSIGGSLKVGIAW